MSPGQPSASRSPSAPAAATPLPPADDDHPPKPRALVALALLLGATTAHAGATADRVGALYANRLLFERSGQPLVTVRLQKGQRSLWVESTGPLRWSLRGGSEEVVETPAGHRWQVRLEGVEPGRRQWWSGVARFAGNDPQRTASALERWQGKGLTARAFETGVLIGLGPVAIDTRSVVIGVRPTTSRVGARRFARRLSSPYGRPVSDWVARPSGWVVARAEGQALEIRARDLLTVEAIHPQDDVVLGGLRWRKQRSRQRRFGGRVEMLVGEDRKLLVLNTAPAETIIEGVVPSEMNPKAPAAALQAQAVAARGQLLARLGTRHRGEPYHICSSTHCQVYSGRTHTRAETSEAVRATRGELLVDAGGLTESVFSSACGGHTEAFHRMWPGRRDAVLRGRPDGPNPGPLEAEAAVARFIDHPPRAWCQPTGTRAGVFRWTARRRGADVTSRIGKRADIGPVSGIKVLERGRSGRALRVEYRGAKGTHVVRGEHLNRKLLGGLKSGLWVVERRGGDPGGEPAEWAFRGGGFGHGVGLCQHGAMGMARAGHSYRSILRHYYPGARLERLW